MKSWAGVWGEADNANFQKKLNDVDNDVDEGFGINFPSIQISTAPQQQQRDGRSKKKEVKYDKDSRKFPISVCSHIRVCTIYDSSKK